MKSSYAFKKRIKKLCPKCKTPMNKFREIANMNKPEPFDSLFGIPNTYTYYFEENFNCEHCNFLNRFYLILEDVYKEQTKNWRDWLPFPQKPIPPKNRIQPIVIFETKISSFPITPFLFKYGGRMKGEI